MRTGAFRADLYYRINVFPVPIPALRERADDIPILASHFTHRYASLMTKAAPQLAPETLRVLAAYSWPGNVRELENCIEYAVLLCNGSLLLPEHLPQSVKAHAPPKSAQEAEGDDTTLKNRVRQMESAVLLDALKKSNGNVCAVAREIGLTARMVRYKLKNFNIDPRQFSRRASAAVSAQPRTSALGVPL
jgi:Nif-specific regulatory protein